MSVLALKLPHSPSNSPTSMPPPTPLSPTGSSPASNDLTNMDSNINTNNNNNITTNNTNITSSTGSPDAPTGIKRKASRRANTAERRATHNAVERQRRETLNGRFLVSSTLFSARHGLFFFYIYYHGFFPLPCFTVLWGSGVKDTGDASASRFRSVWRQDASPVWRKPPPPFIPRFTAAPTRCFRPSMSLDD